MSYPQELQNCQNRDGGWSYSQGASWTEPTCYALLAFAAHNLADSDAARRGARWLAGCQRPDGGLAPRESVSDSTWLTALALLLPRDLPANVNRSRATSWVLSQTGRESGWVYRLRLRLMGVASDASSSFDGWPWYPDAAAWTVPTALSILALEKLERENADPALERRVESGRGFLLARRCHDGGWNHGSTKALGYDSDSYPETTGVALLALHGSQAPEIPSALARAEEHLAACRSHEAASWLTLGLMVHGRTPAVPSLTMRGSVMEMALAAIREAALQGRNLFLG